MSHYTKCKTKISDAAALVAALKDLGFKAVELHETPQNLYGYQGDVREQKAEVILRRKEVGASSNDIGFVRGADGTFEAIISDFDKSRYNAGWLKKLNQRYSYQKVTKELGDMGYEIGDVTTEQGKIKFKAVSVYGG